MKYYKQPCQGAYLYIMSEDELTDPNAEEITEESYNAALAEIEEKNRSENERQEEDSIASLERENAALLYQVLTGEVYEDV